MSEKELDEILEEIKRHALEEAKEEPHEEKTIEPVSPPAPKEEKNAAFEPVEEKVDFSLPVEEEEMNIAPPEPKLTIEEEPAEDIPLPDEADFMNIADNGFSEAPKDIEAKKNKKPLIVAIAVILIIAIGVGIYFGFFHKKDNGAPTSKKAETNSSVSISEELGPTNPLTGETGYSEAALGKRPVAVVVENEYSTESVRPQWGLSDADIVLEGESEYSTRLLLFWADYTNMPDQIGPTRSARPPFIRFSQLFDSVFIHAGLSKTKGNYIGANTVFQNENVDHINLLSYSEDGTFFGRDKSRTSTIEHTGYLNGKNTAELLEKANINTALNEAKFSALEFNEEPQKLSETSASSASFIWSDVHSNGKCPKVGKFYYDEALAKYSTTDFDSDYGRANLEFENLIFLLDETEYVVKENYKGSGNSETYCNYRLSGGKGTILSQGTALEITWGVTNKKLWIKDSNGESVKLNPGKSYIGYGSLNHGGSVTLNYDAAQ